MIVIIVVIVVYIYIVIIVIIIIVIIVIIVVIIVIVYNKCIYIFCYPFLLMTVIMLAVPFLLRYSYSSGTSACFFLNMMIYDIVQSH